MIGLIAKKVGMSRLFLPTGEAVAVTYLKVEGNKVVRVKTKEKDGYEAVVVGTGAKKWKTHTGKELTRYSVQKEFTVDSLADFAPGKDLTLDLFPAEASVTVQGTSKGKGFQGVVRRYHFGGGPGSHGSHFKREPGSIGMRTQPGRVLKGHHMAGHMGLDAIKLKHRDILLKDADRNVLAVRGPVPGPSGSHVVLTLEPSA